MPWYPYNNSGIIMRNYWKLLEKKKFGRRKNCRIFLGWVEFWPTTRNRSISDKMAGSKDVSVKAVELRGKTKQDLEKKLQELKKDLYQLRMSKVGGGQSTNLMNMLVFFHSFFHFLRFCRFRRKLCFFLSQQNHWFRHNLTKCKPNFDNQIHSKIYILNE